MAVNGCRRSARRVCALSDRGGTGVMCGIMWQCISQALACVGTQSIEKSSPRRRVGEGSLAR